MQTDVSIIYYTDNKVSNLFAESIRAHLLSIAGDIPIISVSQKPINLGHNICIGEIGSSIYNCYRQVLIAACAAKTDYVIHCEDDTLYNIEHFAYRPPLDTFAYNKSRWWVEEQNVFRWRNRSAMHAAISPRELLIETLEKRFELYPTHVSEKKIIRNWGEPGRYEGNMGLPIVKLETFMTTLPVVTFNHRGSLMGMRRWNESDRIQESLEPWGYAKELREEMHAT
jgi:hypothetical protein